MDEKLRSVWWQIEKKPVDYTVNSLPYTEMDVITAVENIKNEAYDHLDQLITTLGSLEGLLLELKQKKHIDICYDHSEPTIEK